MFSINLRQAFASTLHLLAGVAFLSSCAISRLRAEDAAFDSSNSNDATVSPDATTTRDVSVLTDASSNDSQSPLDGLVADTGFGGLCGAFRPREYSPAMNAGACSARLAQCADRADGLEELTECVDQFDPSGSCAYCQFEQTIACATELEDPGGCADELGCWYGCIFETECVGLQDEALEACQRRVTEEGGSCYQIDQAFTECYGSSITRSGGAPDGRCGEIYRSSVGSRGICSRP